MELMAGGGNGENKIYGRLQSSLPLPARGRFYFMKKKFPGFSYPEKNFYHFPKDLNGFYSQLTGNEFKVLSYIIRKTWGFNKIEDKISYSQFLKGIMNQEGVEAFDGLGMSKDTLTRCLKSLVKKGFLEIKKEKGKTNCYKLRYSDYAQNQAGNLSENRTTLVRKSDIQYKDNNISLSKERESAKADKLSKLDKISGLSRKREDLAIIFTYARARGLKFENQKQKESFIKRNIRAAQLLKGYPRKKIELWCKILPHLDLKKWTLETVGKFIDEDPIEIVLKQDDANSILEELAQEKLIKLTEKGWKICS